MVLTLLLAVSAVLITAGRIAVGRMDRFEGAIVRSLERSLGARVELEGLRGSWSGLTPVLRVDRARVLAPDSGETVLEIDSLAFELDILESIGRRTVVASSMVVDRVEAAIAETDDGRWHLQGVAPRREARSPTPIVDFLVHSDQVIVRDGRVRIDAPSITALPPVVQGQLMLKNGLLAHRGVAKVSWPGWERRSGGSIEARFDMSALNASMGSLSGDLWVSLDGVDRLDLPLPEQDADLDISLGSTSMWLTLEQGRIVDAATSAEFPRLIAQAGERRLVLDDVLLTASMSADAQDVLAGKLDYLAFRLGAVNYSLSGLSLRLDRKAQKLRFRLPRLDLEQTREIVLGSGLIEEQLSHFIRGMALRGELDDVRGELGFGGDHGPSLALRASARAIRTLDYRGWPEIENLDGELLLTESGGRFRVDSGPFDIDFPDTFYSGWTVDQAQGDFYIQLRDGAMGVACDDLVLETDIGRISGSFGFYRPPDPFEQTISVLATVEHADLSRIKDYLPVELDEDLVAWLNDGLKAGRMPWGAVAYQGHVKRLSDRRMNRVELVGQVEDVVLRYHPDWPAAREVSALVVVSGDWAKAGVSRAVVGGGVVHQALVSVPRTGERVHFRGSARTDGASALHFMQSTPIADMVSFVGPNWQVAGPMEVEFDLEVPLRAAGEPQVALDVFARDMSVEVPELRLSVTDIEGLMHYQHPMKLSASGLSARFLEGKLDAGIDTEVDPATGALKAVDFDVHGEMPVREAVKWLDQPMLDVLDGHVPYQGTLRLAAGETPEARFELDSDLVGVAVRMPAPLGKSAPERRPAHLAITLAQGSQGIEFRYGPDVRSRLTLDDGHVVSGQVGISAPMPDAKEGVVRIAGSVHALPVEDWLTFLQGREDATSLPEITVDELQVDRLTYGHFHFDDVKLILGHAGDLTWVELTNPQIEGSIAFPAGDALPYVNLDFLHLNGTGSTADPLLSWNPVELPEFECNLNEMSIDGAPWGKWAFKVLRTPGGVGIEDLKADLRGVHISGVPQEGGADDPGARMSWRMTPEGPVTDFEGRLEGDDIGEILKAWDFAPSVESKSVWADASVHWNGSPAGFDIGRLGGTMEVNARNGRIVDADTGTTALRVMGIFDFASIARRARLDFSDVFGKGLAFNRIQGELHFDNGRALLESPLEVKGPGSAIRVVGTVDLKTGALDNEMIVTLPVGRTLPWYAAYAVLAANPLAGAGVIVAQRLLKSQLEQLASAKYSVKGTLEAPEVNFVEMFNTKMDRPEEGASEGAPQPQSTPQGAEVPQANAGVPQANATVPQANAGVPRANASNPQGNAGDSATHESAGVTNEDTKAREQ